MITKTELLDAMDLSPARLARILGITRSAVYQWPDDQPIPELQWLRLKDRRPEKLAAALAEHARKIAAPAQAAAA